jgi:PhnB protein
MQVSPYLNFDGRCEEAFKFYEECLGGKIEAMMNHKGSPMADHVPADWQEKILHARLVVGDNVLMGSDAPPQDYKAPNGISLSLNLDNAADADRIFGALAENGTVTMPISETFWAERFGMLIDRFGIPWMINVDKAS